MIRIEREKFRGLSEIDLHKIKLLGISQDADCLSGIALPGIGLQKIGLPGIGLPGIGPPKISLSGIGPLGIGLPGIGLPKIGLPGIGLSEIGLQKSVKRTRSKGLGVLGGYRYGSIDLKHEANNQPIFKGPQIS